MQIRGIRFATTDTSVVDLLKYAYGVNEQEMFGGPKWIKTETFDIVGDPESQTRPSSDEFKEMVQRLLADRFHMSVHYEIKNLPVFEIVPTNAGPKLTKTARLQNGIPSVGYSPGWLTVANATMGEFAAFLQRFVTDRPVLDRTGITGRYDLTLRWRPDELQTEQNHQEHGSNNSLPSLYTAIQEQLGLKLKSARGPVEALVIDRIEQPSPN